MADEGNFTSNALIQRYAGTNANTTAKAIAATDEYVKKVEAKICALSRYDWITAWATLNTNMRGILSDTAAALCAIKVIKEDMSGFTSRYEAETMMDVLRDEALTNIATLRDKKTQTFILGA